MLTKADKTWILGAIQNVIIPVLDKMMAKLNDHDTRLERVEDKIDQVDRKLYGITDNLSKSLDDHEVRLTQLELAKA